MRCKDCGKAFTKEKSKIKAEAGRMAFGVSSWKSNCDCISKRIKIRRNKK